MSCPGCARENAQLARHQAAICRAQDDGPAARVLEAFAAQLEAMAERAEEAMDEAPTEPKVIGIKCPVCGAELRVP